MIQLPLVLVTGATGAQGGSVARALLQQRKFRVRCLTREPSSHKAMLLQRAGAEVVAGNLDDVRSLQDAVKGCYAVFGVTDYREHADTECQQGINLIDAVAGSGVPHFVFSSQPNYCQLSGGRLPVPQCDIKAALEQYCRVLQLPATFIHLSFYYENFLHLFSPRLLPDGNYTISFPQGDAPLAMASVEDTGAIVAAVLQHPAQYIGRTVGVVAENKCCYEYAAVMSKMLNRTIMYQHMPAVEFAVSGGSGAEQWANLFEVQRRLRLNRQLHLIESYGLNPHMQTFRQWLSRNATQFCLPQPKRYVSQQAAVLR